MQMNVFELRNKLVGDYASYTKSFIKIKDPRIDKSVTSEIDNGAFWPEPLIQLNPTFLPSGTIDELVENGTLHSECKKIFRIGKTEHDYAGQQLRLHTHQREAILKAKEEKSYVLTSGTGSGKSLTYIVPIVDHVLRKGSGRGIQAIVVYPMNALANSQAEELGKFLLKGYPEGKPPVRFARYTGQEGGAEREEIRRNPPDILLTNYMMLELMLTRVEDRELVRAAQGLKFLVFDELHTYRGRQGADVALLIRRCRLAFGGHDFICIGTSATMASEGTSEDQKNGVARVAQTLFGTSFDKTQIIGETLERATKSFNFQESSIVEILRSTIANKPEPPSDYDSFRDHPMASWIEATFGVVKEEIAGRLVRQNPQRLQGPDSASELLARLTSTDAASCAEVIRRFLLKGSNLRRTPSSRFPIFAFRLHQFFTRGDTVWATIEAEDVRHLEMSKQVAKPNEPDKLLYPLVFCRQCGAAYYRVRIVPDGNGSRLLPREDRRAKDDDGSGDAYLYLSNQNPWPRATSSELLERLPDVFKDTTVNGEEQIRPDSKGDIPETIFVNAQGQIVTDGQGVRAALIRKNFLFCLEPGCGVAYVKTQRSERAKLATLGVDNRSTATTILAVRSLIELQGDHSLEPEARKLLSFTDNRQDASLQAGHFNDFAQVALLRSALYRAAKDKGTEGLRNHELSRGVFEAMQLRFDEFAADPEVRGPAKNATEDALRRIIDYFLYRDLERGWRVTAPNLEDCGLLAFDYDGLLGEDGLLAEKDLWEYGLTIKRGRNEKDFVALPDLLHSCPSQKLEELLRTLLDVLRRSLAVKVDVLDGTKQLDLVNQTKHRLREDAVWHLDDPREMSKSVVAYPRSKKRSSGEDRYGVFISAYGNYGRYVKRTLVQHVSNNKRVGLAELNEIIRYFFLALKRYGIIEQVRSGREGDDPGYQLNSDAIRWLPGDGKMRPLDRTRLLDVGEAVSEVNKYFVECYRNFIDLKCLLEAREHTAQVTPEDRVEREDRFRLGAEPGGLSLLFCSPTMELGVDIAQLNVVNMRNVPPTPANYAQRSGRAGRGGQPALVYTYCAGRSPHDQYFFREPHQMVAGSVAPPRIDLRNRDLVRSHINAVWMEVAKPDLGRTLNSVLETMPENGKLTLPIKSAISSELKSRSHRAAAISKAKSLVSTIREELEATPWFHDAWTEETLDQVERAFDTACDRWRSLYRAAVRQRELHHAIIMDHARSLSEREHSKRLRAHAENQIRLLTEARGVFEGDFYSYRYFATEGFLPGYNFPRLPISAYVPARRQTTGRNEYVSRPRFLAISEFGPRALVYHEGARYRVNRVNLDFGSGDPEDAHFIGTSTMKRCTRCGYAHVQQDINMAEVCDKCGSPLDASSHIENLIHMQNVSLKLVKRITSDEEERQRYGYKIVTAYRFPEVGGRFDQKDADVFFEGTRLLSLSYSDATDLFRVNLGWANQGADQSPGFVLDLERGGWSTNPKDQDDQEDATGEGHKQRVVPYVKDTKNALVMRFDPPRNNAELASLQAAFKEAILKFFQLEPRELACEPMPTAEERHEILFYESSEGGAGVLRQIVEDPMVFPALARQALEVCHFNSDTLEDLGADTCGKACYACLLDYGNQPDHQDLDRHQIMELLSELSRSECKPAGGVGSRPDRIAYLRRRCDSKLEKKWLYLVDNLLLNLPSEAQYIIESCSTQPDFFYDTCNAAIYIDGPPHDEPDQIRKDEAITRRLVENGYIVVRFHHKDDWSEVFARHPDIFGRPKA